MCHEMPPQYGRSAFVLIGFDGINHFIGLCPNLTVKCGLNHTTPLGQKIADCLPWLRSWLMRA